MAYSITPSLGVDLAYNDGVPYWDPNNTVPSPALGTRVHGSDGREYILVQASADISAASAPGTEVTITEPAMTAAAGSGGWYAPIAGVADDDFFWARKKTL